MAQDNGKNDGKNDGGLLKSLFGGDMSEKDEGFLKVLLEDLFGDDSNVKPENTLYVDDKQYWDEGGALDLAASDGGYSSDEAESFLDKAADEPIYSKEDAVATGDQEPATPELGEESDSGGVEGAIKSMSKLLGAGGGDGSGDGNGLPQIGYDEALGKLAPNLVLGGAQTLVGLGGLLGQGDIAEYDEPKKLRKAYEEYGKLYERGAPEVTTAQEARLNRAVNTSRQEAMDKAGSQLSGAINAATQSTNLQGLRQIAADDYKRRMQALGKQTNLAKTLRDVEDRRIQAKRRRYGQEEAAFGKAAQSGMHNLTNTFNMATGMSDPYAKQNDDSDDDSDKGRKQKDQTNKKEWYKNPYK